MSKTKINIQTISGLTVNSKGEKNNVTNIGSAVNGVRYRTDYKVLNRNGNSRQFSSIQSSISDISTDIGRIFQTIENATNQYIQTEEKIVRDGAAMGLITPKNRSTSWVSQNSMLFDGVYNRSKFGVIGAGVPVGMAQISGGGGRGEKVEEKKSWIGEFFKPFGEFFGTAANVVGSVGVGGKMVDGIYDAVKGFSSGDKKDAGKAIVGIGKTTVSIFGDIAQESCKKADEINWKNVLFGKWEKGGVQEAITKATDKFPNSTKWGASLKYNWKKSYTFEYAETVGDKIKVGAKWLGTALSAVTNGIDNYSDYKDGKMSSERAIKETVMETVVDVGVGLAATATATVLLGASAPAVAIAAGAVLVTWAADSATKFLTKNILGEEKDFTEVVSDAALDIVKGTGDLFQKAGKGLSNAIGNIGTKWRECFG